MAFTTNDPHNTEAANNSIKGSGLQTFNFLQTDENLLSEFLPIAIQSIVIVVMNTQYCIVVLRSRSLKKTFGNILSVGLSLSYILFALGSVTTKVLLFLQYETNNSVVTYLFTQLLSALLITIMTVDRYIAVMKSLHYHSWINRDRVVKAMIKCGIYSLVFTLISLFVKTDGEENVRKFMMSGKSIADFTIANYFGMFYIIYILVWYMGHILPCIICMVGLSIPIVHAVRRQTRKLHTMWYWFALLFN